MQSTGVATMHMRVPRLNRVLSPRRVPTTMWRHSATAGPSVVTPLAVEFIDIFDAPHRLGGSSTLIGLSSPRIIDSSSRQETPSLPDPILYDGPSRGRRSRSLYTSATVLSSSLPPPVVFDGPARRKPYFRPTAPVRTDPYLSKDFSLTPFKGKLSFTIANFNAAVGHEEDIVIE